MPAVAPEGAIAGWPREGQPRSRRSDTNVILAGSRRTIVGNRAGPLAAKNVRRDLDTVAVISEPFELPFRLV